MTKKVLLVDDEEEFLELMAERMRARQMTVTTSTSAADALKQIATGAYDAVVMDFLMPGIDGIEAIKTIKANAPETQIILLTGYATVEKSVEAMKAGAMDFVEKPVNIDALAEKIKKAHNQKAFIIEKKNQDRIIEALRKFGM